MSQKYGRFKGHLDLIDQVSQRTAEMIHKHILTTLNDDDIADEVGEKELTMKQNFNESPPQIFMERNHSSPNKDLSFFNSADLQK